MEYLNNDNIANFSQESLIKYSHPEEIGNYEEFNEEEFLFRREIQKAYRILNESNKVILKGILWILLGLGVTIFTWIFAPAGFFLIAIGPVIYGFRLWFKADKIKTDVKEFLSQFEEILNG
jgi:hypothetical protein